MAAAYGHQDKTFRAAYVAINMKLLDHGVADPGLAKARSLAAPGLLAIGLSAVIASRQGFSWIILSLSRRRRISAVC